MLRNMQAVSLTMTQQLLVSKILDEKAVNEVNLAIATLEQPRWVKRKYLPAMRGVNGATCKYEFCGHAQMPKDVKEFLKTLAPEYQGYPLQELAINRYNVGDYIGQHRDTDLYRKNLVIALQAQGDGLYIDAEDKFIEDVAGQGVLITGVGPIHSVPPVKHLRHCLIYLYG